MGIFKCEINVLYITELSILKHTFILANAQFFMAVVGLHISMQCSVYLLVLLE